MSNQKHIAITHRSIWALAGPIIISNLSIPLVGAVDTAVVGHLPEPDSIGAVALGALIFSFIFWGFGFLKMGTTGFIAQAYGANDQQTLSDTLSRVIMLALSFGLLTILLSYPLIQLALHLLESSERIESLTANYAYIRIWSAPATLCTYVFIGVFIGIHNTRNVLLLLLVLNVSNILLDIVFVLGFKMGVEGVALATLIAEYLAAACGFYLLRDQIKAAWQQFNWETILERKALTILMKANSDIFIRTLCLVFSAAEALTGSAYGAKRRDIFIRAVKLTTFWGFVIALFVSFIYFIFGETILGLFTNIDAVLASAKIYLPWMIITPIISIWSFQLDGIFIGASYTKEMRNAMIVSMLIYLGLLFVLIPQWGNHGLFLGLSLFMIIRAITLGWYYPRIITSMKD